MWYIRYSSLGYSDNGTQYQWGLPNDIPIAADFDGDGKDRPGRLSPGNGMWYIRYSSLGYSGNGANYQWGLPRRHPDCGRL